jgi:hypothetical protein
MLDTIGHIAQTEGVVTRKDADGHEETFVRMGRIDAPFPGA